MPLPAPTWIEHAAEGGDDVLYLQGAWRLAHLPELVAQIAALPGLPTGRRCLLDGSRLSDEQIAGMVVFIAMLLTLIVRPNGLFGNH